MEPCGSMDSGVTTDGMSARSVPAGSSTPPAAGTSGSSTGPVTGPLPRQPVKGSKFRMMRCPMHGIAYDSEREVSADCAKGARLARSPRRRIPH